MASLSAAAFARSFQQPGVGRTRYFGLHDHLVEFGGLFGEGDVQFRRLASRDFDAGNGFLLKPDKAKHEVVRADLNTFDGVAPVEIGGGSGGRSFNGDICAGEAFAAGSVYNDA